MAKVTQQHILLRNHISWSSQRVYTYCSMEFKSLTTKIRQVQRRMSEKTRRTVPVIPSLNPSLFKMGPVIEMKSIKNCRS